MKRTSSFLLIAAMLLTMLVPMLALGVVAEVPDGAVAYYEQNGETKYAYSLAEAFAVGATANNGVDTVNLVANQTITLDKNNRISVSAGKSFTIKGNNCKLTEDGSIVDGVFMNIKGSSIDTVVTLEGFNIKLGTVKANVHVLEVGTNNTDTPVTVVLKNTVIEENRQSYATVVLRQASKLVVDDGASIINNNTAGPWDSRSYGVLVTGSGTLEVRNGGTLSGYTEVIKCDSNAAASKVIINGGTVSSTSNLTIDNLGTVEINGGSVTSAGIAINSTGTVKVNGGSVISTNNVAIQNGGNLTVSGGSVTSNKGEGGTAITSTNEVKIEGGTIKGDAALSVNGGTATVEGGEFIAAGLTALVANTGASATINGGLFTTSTESLALRWGWGLVTVRGGAIAVNGGEFYYPMAGKNGAGHVLQKIDSGTIAFNGGSVYATPYKVYNGSTGHWHVRFENFNMVEGASVRTDAEKSGIRFESKISKADVELANSISGGKVTFGTVIAPYEYVQQAGMFTMAALDRTDIKVGGVSVDADKKYVNIVAKDGMLTDAEGNVTIRAALVDLNENNYAREFAAISYISYETAGGTVIIYSAFDADKNVRSMREVAYKALEDVKTVEETEYGTVVNEWYAFENNEWVKKTGTAYSCYSVAQLNVIKSYLPKN